MDSPATIVWFSKPSCCLVFLFMFLIHCLPCALSNPENRYCQSLFECGNITAGFPFLGENLRGPCGHPLLKLHCDRASNTTTLNVTGVSYEVLNIDHQSNILRLVRKEFLESFSVCSVRLLPPMLPPELFELSPSYKDLTIFYQCEQHFQYLGHFTCPRSGSGSIYQSPEYNRHCREAANVTVPVSFFADKEAWSFTHLESVLKEGFEVKVKFDEEACRECSSSGGTCSFHHDVQICCKEDSSQGFKCDPSTSSKGKFLIPFYHS